ncbi:alkaline phosphatase family protein [Haloarcula amylolytica]|uniref:alkaline phosphatase family protein n=1 Tax=Haloarcula amylolytica TaxID=396317 RepID=UPI003C789F1F
MAQETLTVLALDAADHDLLKRWDCENILLDNNTKLETYCHTYNHPSTVEVWATMATGVGPEDHNAIMGPSMEWHNPLVNFASEIATVLPDDWREWLGRFAHNFSNAGYPQTDLPHVFEEGLVAWWPGITPAETVVDAVKWTTESVVGENLGYAELWGNMKGNCARSLAYLEGASEFDVPIVGAHCHMLDTAGHTFSKSEDELRKAYKWVDEQIGQLEEEADRLVILSDHGMQTNCITEDTDPGTHSMRAIVSTNFEASLPNSVFDVSDWLEKNTLERAGEESKAMSDTTREQLEDLGYI